MYGFEGARRATACLALCICCLCNAGAYAQQANDDDIVITTHRIDAVRDARTPWDETKSCLRDPACATAVNLLASEIGITAIAVRLVNIGAALSAKAEGEETRYPLPALSGRKFCRVHVQTTSVVPATGDRASLFSITASPANIGIYTWTPRQGIFAGRTWYDGYVFVAHVKAELADEYTKAGKCTVPLAGNPAGYECRGATGINHGLVACGSKDL
jgi:hypothetical protein